MDQIEVSLGLGRRRFPRGMHLCYVYNDDDERADVLARFFAAGAEAGDKMMYVTDGRDPALIRPELARRGATGIGSPAFEAVSSHDAYLRNGRFRAEDMFALLRDFYVGARADGYAGARVSGEMAWMLGDVGGKEEVLPYEARVTRILAENPTTAICQYDARRFSGETLMDMLAIHPYTIVRGQVVENPYFTDPEAYLARVARTVPH